MGPLELAIALIIFALIVMILALVIGLPLFLIIRGAIRSANRRDN